MNLALLWCDQLYVLDDWFDGVARKPSEGTRTPVSTDDFSISRQLFSAHADLIERADISTFLTSQGRVNTGLRTKSRGWGFSRPLPVA